MVDVVADCIEGPIGSVCWIEDNGKWSNYDIISAAGGAGIMVEFVSSGIDDDKELEGTTELLFIEGLLI